jgi:MFS family permease
MGRPDRREDVPEPPTGGAGSGARGLPRQFWLLSGGAFVFLIGYNMCYPFQTLYLSEQLGLSVTSIGLLIGASLLLGLPLQIAGGVAVDRFGRRPVLALAIFAAVCLLIGLGVSRQLGVVITVIAFEAVCGWALFITSTNAMVADLTPWERRSEAFSILRVAMNAGITLGPLVAAPLIARDPSFRVAFVVGGFICAAFLLLVVTRLGETRPSAVRPEPFVRAFRGYRVIARDRRLLLFCLVALLPLYDFGQVWVTMPLMLGDLQGVSAAQWGLLMVAYGLLITVLQYPVVRLLRRRNDIVSLAAASCCLGVGVGAAPFVPYPGTFLCVAAVALGLVLFIPISATVVSHLAPTALRGRYMGAWTLVYMGGYALGPLLGGRALDALGGRAAFLLAGALGVAGGAVFVLLRTRLRPPGGASDFVIGTTAAAPGHGPAAGGPG